MEQIAKPAAGAGFCCMQKRHFIGWVQNDLMADVFA
jgi:hypothetical protein